MKPTRKSPLLAAIGLLALLTNCHSKEEDARPAGSPAAPNAPTAPDYRSRYVGDYAGTCYWLLLPVPSSTDTLYICGTRSYSPTLVHVRFQPADTIYLGTPRVARPAIWLVDTTGRLNVKAYVDSVTHQLYTRAGAVPGQNPGAFIRPDSLVWRSSRAVGPGWFEEYSIDARR